MNSGNTKLYSEEEIGAILKKTAELSKGRYQESREGLSLQELQELAAEAGLNPDLVSRAAAEVAGTRLAPAQENLFGGPLSFASEIDLGVPVSEETWELMLPLIRAFFNDPGIVQDRKGVREWTGNGRSGSHISVHESPGGSRLTLFWSDPREMIPLFMPTAFAAVLSPAILFESMGMGLIGIPIYILIVSTFFMMSRFGVKAVKKRKAEKMGKLGRELASVALQQTDGQRNRAQMEEGNGAAIVGNAAMLDVPSNEYDDESEGRDENRDAGSVTRR
jgi:hypothetical protein